MPRSRSLRVRNDFRRRCSGRHAGPVIAARDADGARSGCCDTPCARAECVRRDRVLHARAAWIATLDGDGQNDPADIPGCSRQRKVRSPTLKLVMGNRATRRDTWLPPDVVAHRQRPYASTAARRNAGIRGCGYQGVRSRGLLGMPRSSHARFMPALLHAKGFSVTRVPVNHRSRTRGTVEYVLHNASGWIVDLLGSDLVDSPLLAARDAPSGISY